MPDNSLALQCCSSGCQYSLEPGHQWIGCRTRFDQDQLPILAQLSRITHSVQNKIHFKFHQVPQTLQTWVLINIWKLHQTKFWIKYLEVHARVLENLLISTSSHKRATALLRRKGCSVKQTDDNRLFDGSESIPAIVPNENADTYLLKLLLPDFIYDINIFLTNWTDLRCCSSSSNRSIEIRTRGSALLHISAYAIVI